MGHLSQEWTMAKPKTDDLWGAYRVGLASFLGALERAEVAGKFNDPANFASMLNLGLTRFGLAASDLSREEEISKGAISKWMNGLAVPPAPTRKTVINWIKRKSQEQLERLDR
jgi:hypothetical protein